MTDKEKDPKKDDLEKQIELAMANLHKQFGKGSIMKMGGGGEALDSLPTGSLRLDQALGIGGFARGRIVEMYGPESTGKSTVALSSAAKTQVAGGKVLYIDIEHALDPEYAEKLGVNIDDLIISQPDTGEEALDILETMVRTGAVSLAVIDSVAALIPRAELEGDMSDNHMGLQPRMMARAMRKLPGAAHKSGCTILFINQLRSKVGVFFGSPEITPGGNALKYAASQRIDLRIIDKVKDKDGNIAGSRVRAKVVKNKTGPPHRQAEFEIMYGKGINNFAEIIEMAVEIGVAKKAGAWYSYNDTQLGQGLQNAAEFLASDLELYDKIFKEVM